MKDPIDNLNSNLIPMVVEQSSRGEGIWYLFEIIKRRIIF